MHLVFAAVDCGKNFLKPSAVPSLAGSALQMFSKIVSPIPQQGTYDPLTLACDGATVTQRFKINVPNPQSGWDGVCVWLGQSVVFSTLSSSEGGVYACAQCAIATSTVIKPPYACGSCPENV